MSSYLYELPTTGAISFGDFCYDKSASYISEVSDTTEARANLRAALKAYKRSDDNEKDYLRLVKVLDDYIPRLYGILAALNAGELVPRSEPIFSWRTTLSSTLFHTSPRLSFPSLTAELAFTLLTYAFALSNLARAVVASLGAYETERGISDAGRRAKDDRLQFAVTLLCKAAGVFEYIAKNVLGEWDAVRERVGAAGMSCPHPPDLSREVLIGLSKMALADAQNLAIRKLLTRAAYESTVTPGPPLPKSHPSPALASKLHLECAALYTSARALAKTAGASRPALSPTSSSAKSKFKLGLGGSNKDGSSAEGGGGGRDDADEVVPELRRYLSDEIAVHNALAHKWLGVDAGENGGPQQTGTAVGFLTWSKKELEDLKNGGSAGGMAVGTMGTEREKEMREARKARVLGDLESVNVFFKGYKRMNDSMSFQIVPPQSDLQASIPAGRMAIEIRPYTKPVPAFGPGSADYVQKMAEELESLGVGGEGGGGGGGDSSGTSPAVPPHKAEASYAGAGSYY